MVTNAQVEALITDIRFQEIKFFQEKANIFTIVGQTHTEHWHSSFIRWLLDAHSSLRLGHFPLVRLLTLYMIKNPQCGFDLRDIYRWHLDDIVFSTEKDASYGGKKRSIDVYGESSELILVIENKVNARENFNKSSQGQTVDYYEYVEQHKRPDQRALYFFITADQRQTPHADMYVQITYQEMYDSIISKCVEHPRVSPDGKYLLEQYAANLRESVHNSNTPMALVNIDKCKSLYEDYTEILDEIFAAVEGEERYTESANPGCIVYSHYSDVFDEIYLSVDEQYGRTPKNKMERQVVTFTDLYKRGLVKNGTPFTMKYDGEVFYARAVLSEDGKDCFLQILDENRQPYIVNGKVAGIYRTSSAAGVDVINFRRKEKGITQRVKTLRGTTYWVNEAGQTIRDLIDQM